MERCLETVTRKWKINTMFEEIIKIRSYTSPFQLSLVSRLCNEFHFFWSEIRRDFYSTVFFFQSVNRVLFYLCIPAFFNSFNSTS